MNDDETRIAKVFRLAHGSKLPDVSKKFLTIYDDPEFYGLFCQGTRGRWVLEVPLATIEVIEDGNNQVLIDDYKNWFENYR